MNIALEHVSLSVERIKIADLAVLRERELKFKMLIESLRAQRATFMWVCGTAVIVLGSLYLLGEVQLLPALIGIGAFVAVVVGRSVITHYLGREELPDTLKHSGELTNKEFRSVLVKAMTEPCIFVNPEGRVEVANEAARQNFRFRGEMPILSSVVRRPEMLGAVEDALSEKEPQDFAFVERGEYDRTYACVAAPVKTNSGLGVLITMEDLTAVKRAELARADFLANASHELRTPLTSLAGFIETMRGPAKDDREAWDHFLEIMEGQAERMRRLINDLLSLSRIELSEHRRPSTNADLAAVVSEVGAALLPVADGQQVKINITGQANGIEVMGVRDELAQVAQNLIDNAIKYSEPDDVVEVEVLTGLSQDEALEKAGRRMDGAAQFSITNSLGGAATKYAVLRVRDNGPGMDRKYLPRLSERFYRIDPGRGLKKGTGLGLAIVKHIMNRHRGAFLVESELGVGTAFGVLFPLSHEDKELSDLDQLLEERAFRKNVPKEATGS
ncbi:sensor histidine kinase [Hirschia baltica]|nr:ATP-binding protein [Hirschia baltica]